MNRIAVAPFLLPLALVVSSYAHADGFRPFWQCTGLRLKLVGPSSAENGTIIHYQMEVTNVGSCDLSALTVTDYIPRSTVYESANPQPSIKPAVLASETTPRNPPPLPIAQVQWRNIHLTPTGSTATYETTVEIQSYAGSTLSNTACVEHPLTGRVCDTSDTAIK
jgi:uncharacterized repeat protein (TIGR01451 family)